MADSIFYKINSGKPSKAWFFIKGLCKDNLPHSYYLHRKDKMLQLLSKRKDYDYIMDRVNYYIKLTKPVSLPAENRHEYSKNFYHFIDEIKQFRPSTFHKAYYLDLHDATNYFDQSKRICYIPGDVYFTPQCPALVKSRLLTGDNSNSVILKLDKLRHFMFVNDKKEFTQKMDKAIFRGKIRVSRQREQFLEMYFQSPFCDCGVVDKQCSHPEWITPKKTIREHLDYKFIMALEGNDVASNLKWVMSSNSIAVMPRPTCETWFMEGRLVPNVHYIEIKSDLSDLEERINYYSSHPEEAQTIINNAHQYVEQFFDKEREEIIQILVLQKYFDMTNQ